MPVVGRCENQFTDAYRPTQRDRMANRNFFFDLKLDFIKAQTRHSKERRVMSQCDDIMSLK
jgi:hypothetical protein